MAYKHGVYSVQGTSIGAAPVHSAQTLVVIGSTKTGAQGKIGLVTSKENYVEEFGWGDDFSTYTAESVIDYAFGQASLAEVVVISTGATTGDTSYAACIPLVKKVYAEVHRRPTLVVVPEHGEGSDVEALVVAACTDVAGPESYDCVAFLGMNDHGGVPSAYVTAKDDMVSDKHLAYFAGGFAKDEDHRIEVATIAACEQIRMDAKHDDIPYCAASNVGIAVGGESETNFAREDANTLNAVGINTVAYLDGVRLWGAHLSTFDDAGSTDGSEIFIPGFRMIQDRRLHFLRAHALEIDSPMTRSLIDAIISAEQADLDRLVGLGALVGHPSIRFVAEDNPASSVASGRFMWRMEVSPTTPFTAGTLSVAWTDEGYSSMVEG